MYHSRCQELLEKTTAVYPRFFLTVLIDEANCESAFQMRAEVVQSRKAIFCNMCAADCRCSSNSSSVVIEAKSMSIICNKLLEDGDAYLEWNDEGDCDRFRSQCDVE